MRFECKACIACNDLCLIYKSLNPPNDVSFYVCAEAIKNRSSMACVYNTLEEWWKAQDMPMLTYQAHKTIRECRILGLRKEKLKQIKEVK